MKLSFAQFAKGSKLRSRFTFFFVMLAVVPLLILGGVSLYLSDISHRHDVSALEMQLINQKIEEIQKFFDDTMGILELRVDLIESEGSARIIDLESQRFLLEGLLEENPAFEEVSFINITPGLVVEGKATVAGEETVKVSRLSNEPKRSIVSELSNFTQSSRGKNYIGDVYYTISGPAINLAVPVKDENGTIIHVLSAEVNLSQVTRSIESAQLGSIGYLALIDKSGYLVAHRGRSDINSGVNVSSISRVKELIGGMAFDGLGERDRYISFISLEAVVGAGKHIPGLEWIILAEWPLSDADSVINDIRNQVVLYAIVSIFAVLLIAPLFAWRLEQPIRRLEEGARNIETGNFDKVVDIRTGDELEDLGNSFNKMAKGLKRLEELREEFVFIAAHELRSPVTVIKGYASMALEKSSEVSERIKEYLGEITSANNRLAQLVEDLLEVARSEAGRINIQLNPIDIRVPISESVNELKSLAQVKLVSISYEAKEALPNGLADVSRVKEIIVNLVGNGIKYTPNGGYVKIYHETANNELITHIEDSGFGIPKDAQGRIFEKFYRVQTKDTKDIQGTGLGLFIVKQIVEKMGGKIWFKSQEGKGSRFSFSLKIAK